MNKITSPLAVSPLQTWHRAHGARFLDQDGWRIPAGYSDATAETEAIRTGVALADISSLAKLDLRGKDPVQSLMSRLSLKRGKVGLLDQLGIACILTEEHALLISWTARNPFDAWLRDLPGYRPERVFDVTTKYAGIGLVGPDHATVLRGLTSFDVDAATFPAGSSAETGLAGVHAILVRPPTPRLATLMLVAWDVCEYVWERLMESAARDLLVPVGLESFGTLSSG